MLLSYLRETFAITRYRRPVVFLGLFLCVVFSQLNHADDKAKEAELKKLKATIEQLRKELEATKSNRQKINQELEQREKNIGELGKKAKEIQEKLKERKENLEELREERGQLNDKKRGQEAIVGDYINAAYRLGQQGTLRLLLNQEDPARVSRNLKYYDYFVSARAEKIGAYVATIDRLNAIEPEITRQTERIQTDLAQLNQQKTRLLEAQADRKVLLAKINSQIHSQDQKLRSLQEDRRQLERVLSAVVANIDDSRLRANSAKFSSLKGKLPWPTKGKIVRNFGSSRVANKMRWEGLLIASGLGDPVQAIHYGRVVFSDYLRGHGLLVIVDHGSGFLSLYAHNQALYKELGEWVESGETIASVGNSGGQQDAALYFELRYKGKPTDPRNWFRSA